MFNKVGQFKDIPIMEDYDLNIRLRKGCQLELISDPPLIVSARRHVNSGFYKTRLQWILIKKFYLLGVSPIRLASWYRNIR